MNKKYVQPEIKVIDIDDQEVLCSSYENGSLSRSMVGEEEEIDDIATTDIWESGW